jgi:hypothetical protein
LLDKKFSSSIHLPENNIIFVISFINLKFGVSGFKKKKKIPPFFEQAQHNSAIIPNTAKAEKQPHRAQRPKGRLT